MTHNNTVTFDNNYGRYSVQNFIYIFVLSRYYYGISRQRL
jgi:hypothetical protein